MKIQPVTQRFKLNESTRNELKQLTPEFGFNGLGELVFRRTYSRNNEDWCDVVIRVVEGCMSIRKEHFHRSSLFWDDNERQDFARNMALSLFRMEWLPPGRGLWMMGTDFTYERGSMSLNNCFQRETKFWTNEGLKSFSDFKDGDSVVVRGKNKWVPATVKCFGQAPLWKLTVGKSGIQNTIFVTANHRWITRKIGTSVEEIQTTGELISSYDFVSFEKGNSEYDTQLSLVGNSSWRVIDVEPTERVEDVWCVVEPEFEEFTLENGILTKNCSATDTEDDFVHSAEWTMDGLMNGVGVGFTTNWRGEATMPDKKDSEIFVIPDSREGWVESLIKLMCSYINSPRYGKNKFPIFDYSQIRAHGEPIKGFGGTASGFDPLKQMHERIESYLDAFCIGRLQCTSKTWKEFKSEDLEQATSEWREVEVEVDKPYSHTRLVADVFNAIGACVVAGNVRRSAEISLGYVDDKDFMNLKNYEINPERSAIGWLSNNSVVLRADHGYKDFSYIPELARRILDNGEPGMINLYNIQKYGRSGKELPDDATMVNPCFSGDTLIGVADGRNSVSIKQLAEEGKDVPVYSINKETMEVSIKWGRNPRITGHNQKLLRIHFGKQHKGQFVDVTPNHKCFTNDGRIVEAKDLKKNDSLPMFRKGKNGKDDYIVVHSKGKRLVEHRMIKEFYETKKFYENFKEGYTGCCKTNGVVVHHKDENKQNNDPDNLEITTAGEHTSHHNEQYRGVGNPMYGRQHSQESKDLIAARVFERCSNPEYRKMLSDAQTPEMREKSAITMTQLKRKLDIEHSNNLEIIAQESGLKTARFSETDVKIIRECENCQEEFYVVWSKRESAYCSISCANTKAASIESRKRGQKVTFEEKARLNFHEQAMIYKDLCEEKENVSKIDWEAECKTKNISYRFNRKSDNPYIAKGWKEFKEMVDGYNHQISEIEELDGDHTVYNITVDDNHTVAVVTKVDDDKAQWSGVLFPNCGEIPLENFELCNLAEVFPPRCSEPQKFYKALEYATLYASTVSLLPTHRPETNAVIAKNRRIGVSISGIAQWASKSDSEEWGQMNYTKMITFLRKGYKIVRETNTRLAKESGVPAAVRVTTVKPSGSISLLAGATPGVHYPVSRYAIRRVRIGMTSPLVQPLIAAGVPHEKDIVSENTYVFEFVIDHGDVRPCEEVSPWEQFSVVQMMQKHYADNCVSATIYFDKEKDGPDVEKMLAMFIPNLKSVSMLPHSGHGYQQAPYEKISLEEYNRRKNEFKPIDYKSVKNNVPSGSKFCSGDTCEL